MKRHLGDEYKIHVLDFEVRCKKIRCIVCFSFDLSLSRSRVFAVNINVRFLLERSLLWQKDKRVSSSRKLSRWRMILLCSPLCLVSTSGHTEQERKNYLSWVRTHETRSMKKIRFKWTILDTVVLPTIDRKTVSLPSSVTYTIIVCFPTSL